MCSRVIAIQRASRHRSQLLLFAGLLPIALAGCGPRAQLTSNSQTPVTVSPIQHIVVIMQENRSFDNFFHGFPGADSATSGMNGTTTVPLTPVDLSDPRDLPHSHPDWWQDWNNGAMDGFGRAGSTLAYSYVPSSQIQAYWTLAEKYTLADHMFQSNTGPSFVAHEYMIAGQSDQADENPSSDFQWGCDAPAGTTVPLVGPAGTDLPGVYPCFDYQTMADLLDAAGISWRYYAPPDGDSIWSAYEAIRHIFTGQDWTKNVITPQTQVLTDIANRQLAQVTWICPDFTHSDHPGSGSNEGPDWVASIVNAIGASPFWKSTAIFVSWDDWGGWYDHVAPQEIDNMGPGFRVPLIVVSPYAKHGYVSHQIYETASLLTYMEKVFNLPSLGARDATTNDLTDCFDYSQSPAAYTPLPTVVSPERLLREPLTGPPDDD